MSSTVNSMVVGGRRSIFRFRFLFPACGVHFPVLEIVIRYICVSCVESIEVFVHKAQSEEGSRGQAKAISHGKRTSHGHGMWCPLTRVFVCVRVHVCVCVHVCLCALFRCDAVCVFFFLCWFFVFCFLFFVLFCCRR